MSILIWIKNKLIAIYLWLLNKYLYLHDVFFTMVDNYQLAVWARLENHLRLMTSQQTLEELAKEHEHITLEDYDDFEDVL